MDNDDNTNIGTSAAVSPICPAEQNCDLSIDTSLADDDLIENMLPMLCATPVSICRRLVLQQAVKRLGFSMYETTTYDDESNEILTAIQIDVPQHVRVARMEIKTFYGDWSKTTDAAIQSACFNALVYLQKVKVLTIDGIHSTELKKCQRELQAANSWAGAFKDKAEKLQLTLSRILKEKNPVLAIPQIPTKVTLLQDSVNTKSSSDGKILAPSGYPPVPNMKETCTNKQLLTSSGSSQITQVIDSKEPYTNAAINRKKRKMYVDSLRSREKAASLLNLPLLDGSCSENMCAAVTDLSNESGYAGPNNFDTGCTSTALATPPSINKPTTLRMRNALVDCKVRRPLFHDDEDKVEASELGYEVEDEP